MDLTEHTFIAETGLPAQRRRKVRLACNPCRARKTGCDGRKPVCTACSLRGWNERCGWQDSVLPTSNALTLVDLDRRLQRLETGARADAGPSRNISPDTGSTGLSQEAPRAPRPRIEDPDASENDGSDDAANSIQVHSNFMRHAVSAAVPGSQNAGPTHPAVPERLVPNMIGFAVETLDPSFGVFDRQAIVLPLQSFADDLIRWYWRHVHTNFPILHRQTFEAQYNSLWSPTFASSGSGHNHEELVFHATLNMVLALGCQRNESISPNGREFHADEYYRRSQRLISVETLDASSLSLVQLLLLRTLHLYFATRADRCWIMFGAAVRMAIGMGLHTPGPKRGNVSQLEREMKRRVWHCGCLTIDQILSTTFGRPTMIYKEINKAPHPLIIDDHYLSATEEGRQPDNIPAQVAHSIYSLRFAEILDEMRMAVFTARLKASQSGSSSSDSIGPDTSTLLRLNSRIDDFFGGAPPQLQPDADYRAMGVSEDDEICFRIQSKVLRSRMTMVRLLLLRPSVLAEVQRWASSTPPTVQSSTARLEERLHKEVCELCLSAVHTSLEEMHQNLYHVDEFPAWHSLHVTFAAATVLVAATLSPTLGVNFDTEPTRTSWNRAIQIMERHKHHVASAAKGIEVLHRFRKYISSRVATRQSFSQTWSNPLPSVTTQVPSFNTVRDKFSPGSETKVELTSPFGYDDPYYSQLRGQQPGELPLATPVEDTGVSMMEGLDDYLSNELDQAWLATQDWGQNDWMLNLK